MANVTNWTTIAENKKVFIEAQTRYTKNYAYENVYIRSQGLKTLGVGKYRWMNRPQQKFEYAEALKEALVQWLGKKYVTEISQAVEDSSNAQVVLDYLTTTLNLNDEAGKVEEALSLTESSLRKGEYKISDTEVLTWGWEKGYNGGSYYVNKLFNPSVNSDMWSTEFHRTYANEEAAKKAFNRYKNQYQPSKRDRVDERLQKLEEKLIEKYFVENLVIDSGENDEAFLLAVTDILGPAETEGGYIKEIKDFKIRHRFNVYDNGVDAAIGVFFDALVVTDEGEEWMRYDFLHDANEYNPIYQAWYNEDGEIESDYTTIYNITVSSEIMAKFIEGMDGENVWYLIEPVETALYNSIPNPNSFEPKSEEETIKEAKDPEGDFNAAYAIFASAMDDREGDFKGARENITSLFELGGIKKSRYEYIIKNWPELLAKYKGEKDTHTETADKVEEAVEQPIRGRYVPEYVWQAVCSARPMDFRTIKKYFEKPSTEKNKRYNRFGIDHSLIMGAARNNNWEMVDLLKSYSETITADEEGEFEYYDKQRKMKNEAYEFSSEEKAAKVEAFNEMAEELANDNGYPNKEVVENRITEYLKRVGDKQLTDADFVYNFIDELMLATGIPDSNPDYDTMMDYYLNIVYTNEAFCDKLDKCEYTFLDESKDSITVPFDKDQSLGADVIRALPKKYGYFMESEMTGIIVAVLADSKEKLVDNEESILKITYADEDTTEVENELKGLGLIQVCSEDDSLVRVEDDEFKTHWLANLEDGKQYQVEEVSYDSWRF